MWSQDIVQTTSIIKQELHMVNIAVDILRKFIYNYKAYGKLKCLISPVSSCVLEFVMQTIFWNQMLWKLFNWDRNLSFLPYTLLPNLQHGRFCRKKMISFSTKNLPKNYYFIAVKSCQNLSKSWAKHSFIVIYYICLSVKNTERKAKKKKKLRTSI